MVLKIFITILLVLINGFFVAAEFAMVKVRASRLELKVKAGNRFAVMAQHIVSHLYGYLAATQLGITLASLGLGWIGQPVVSKIILTIMDLFGLPISAQWANGIALPLAFALITVLHIIFGELAPKAIAIQRSERTALLLAYPLQFFYIMFRPFIWMLNAMANAILKALGTSPVHGPDVHSSEELKYLVRQGQESGRIDESEYKIIKNAFDFSEQIAKQIMVPRVEVVAIDVNDWNTDTLNKIIEEGYSRIPCYKDNLDNIIGMVSLKDILITMRKSETFKVQDIMRSIIFTPETKRIGQLLNEFQAKHQQIAVVVNEYGGAEGIITMEDILEELVGEIQDEYDNETPFVEKTGEKTYTVIAKTPLDDINEMLPHPIEKDEQYETLAGCLVAKFGKIPTINDKITFDNYEFSIMKRNKNSILMVQLVDLAE